MSIFRKEDRPGFSPYRIDGTSSQFHFIVPAQYEFFNPQECVKPSQTNTPPSCTDWAQ